MERLVDVYIFLAHLFLASNALTTVYMSSTCTTGGSSVTTSLRVQSSTALTYSNNINCRYAITAPTGYKVNANTRRFDLEHKRSGVCVDYVNFYDGGVTATSANLLNTSPYCEATVPPTITANGNVLTLEFITDSSAQYYGFDIIFAAVKAAPCSSTEFGCSNGMCIDSSLECDGLNQCGDSSDESQCTQAYLDSKNTKDNSALIAGLCIGLGSLVLIAVIIAIYVYRQYRWKRFLRDPLPVMQQWDDGNNYPVTRKYYKQKYNNYAYQSTDARKPTGDITSDDDIDAMEPVKKSRPASPSSSTSKVKDKKFADTRWTSEA